jgi:hypothetical protein
MSPFYPCYVVRALHLRPATHIHPSGKCAMLPLNFGSDFEGFALQYQSEDQITVGRQRGDSCTSGAVQQRSQYQVSGLTASHVYIEY